MANPGDFAYTVKQQADIVRIVGDYVKLKKAGAQNYSGLCPFHNEKTPSFSVHATRQFYHCFGCGVSGDVFTFVQKIENITFPEAVRVVAQKFGIPLPKVDYASPKGSQRSPSSRQIPRCPRARRSFLPGACAARKAPTPANTSPAAAWTKRPSRSSASATRPTQASCCATALKASSTKKSCAKAACSPGKKRPVRPVPSRES